jgi:hypothetical protein
MKCRVRFLVLTACILSTACASSGEYSVMDVGFDQKRSSVDCDVHEELKRKNSTYASRVPNFNQDCYANQ